MERQKIDPSRTFKIKNATIETEKEVFRGVLPNKEFYVVLDLKAEINQSVAVKKFPFDAQNLIFQIEENQSEFDEVLYSIDKENPVFPSHAR